MLSLMHWALLCVASPVGLFRCMTSGLENQLTLGISQLSLYAMMVRYLGGASRHKPRRNLRTTSTNSSKKRAQAATPDSQTPACFVVTSFYVHMHTKKE